MVAISTVKNANKTLPSTLPEGLTAVFLGATSGIGQSALKQFAIATRDKSPRIYIVGRSRAAATPLIAELRQSNTSATFEFIERDVSLVRDADAAVKEIIQRESKVDFLFLSMGFIAFEGRKETAEGLEPSMTTRFYSRTRAIELLLPLLNRSDNPHVTNILAGGQEGPIDEDDLDLARPGNYSFIKGSVHSATMLTLLLERFAKENPKISFVHAYPGLTSTPTFTRGSSGIVGFLFRWFISPVLTTLATSADDVGARALFYATNARYTVESTAASANPIPQGLDKAKQSAGGVFLVDAKSESADNEKVLGELRVNVGEKVWNHTREVFERVIR
ncbi:Fc.00g033560.m01.CDS01 [Cosmosporella sp. VM-42]